MWNNEGENRLKPGSCGSAWTGPNPLSTLLSREVHPASTQRLADDGGWWCFLTKSRLIQDGGVTCAGKVHGQGLNNNSISFSLPMVNRLCFRHIMAVLHLYCTGCRRATRQTLPILTQQGWRVHKSSNTNHALVLPVSISCHSWPILTANWQMQ